PGRSPRRPPEPRHPLRRNAATAAVPPRRASSRRCRRPRPPATPTSRAAAGGERARVERSRAAREFLAVPKVAGGSGPDGRSSLLQLPDKADDLGHGAIVLRGHLLVDLYGSEQGASQGRVLHGRHAVLACDLTNAQGKMVAAFGDASRSCHRIRIVL